MSEWDQEGWKKRIHHGVTEGTKIIFC